MYTNLSEFCAPGCQFNKQLISVSRRVSLNLVTFYPSKPSDLPPILFVPGWISLIVGWQSVLKTMTRDFVVYYLETREKISSVTRDKVNYAVPDFGQDIAKAIEILNLKPREYLIFASSLGATSVVDGYAKIKNPPLGVILIGPNAVFHIPPFWLNIVRHFRPRLYLAIKPVVKWYLRNFRLDPVKDQAQYAKYCHNLDHADPWKLKQAALAFAKYSIWDKLPLLTCPTLIVGASHDALHDNLNLQRMAQSMPQAHYVDLGTNSRSHSPVIVDYIFEFLAEIKATSPK